MTIKAEKLKESKIPERRRLYEVSKSRNIQVKEQHDDGSLDQVTLAFSIEDEDIGYFANEYLPDDVNEDGAKRIDITAVMLNQKRKCVRWHLYDIKATLAGEHTVVQLCNQWNAGLWYLQQNVLDLLPEYSKRPDLGVITRCFDQERMKRLRNHYQGLCDKIINFPTNVTLSQRKKRPDIAKYRGTLRAAQSILDRKFQAENGIGTYEIHIKELLREDERTYKIRLPV